MSKALTLAAHGLCSKKIIMKYTNCDVICEKEPNGETNSVFIDQCFQTLVMAFVISTVRKKTKTLIRDEYRLP